MKVGIVGYGHPGENGGIQTFVRNLSKIDADLKYVYYGKDGDIVHDVDPKLTLIRPAKTNSFKVELALFIKNISKYICELDVVILNNPFLLLGLSAKDLEGKKIILVQHNTKEFILSEPFTSKVIQNIIEKKIIKHVDTFVTLSNYDQEQFSDWNIDMKTIRHMSDINREIITQKNKKIIIMARHAKQKRIDIAIDVAEKLPDYEFNVYGNGPLIDENKKYCESKKITNVKFHNPTNKVKETLDVNAIMLLTSDYEGYGIVAIEAMRRGLSVVLRNTYPAAKDLENLGAVLVDTSDPVLIAEKIVDTYNNFENISERSFQNSTVFNEENFVEKWTNIIEE